jgi:hypothetical protein
MLKNYILIRYDFEGREIERNDESGCARFEFYSFYAAIRAMEIATTMSERAHCVKLFRRRRSGGYRWIATYLRGGAHLTSWGE